MDDSCLQRQAIAEELLLNFGDNERQEEGYNT